MTGEIQTKENGMPYEMSKALQHKIMQAVRSAMTRFEKSQNVDLEEFTCYGRKESNVSNRQLAYVCVNIKTSLHESDKLNNSVLETWIRDDVSSCVRKFQGETKMGVDLFLVRHVKRTHFGQNYTMLGYHWHTQCS
jgi:hypothetical protein